MAAAPLTPTGVQSPGAGRFEVLEEYTVEDHEQHVQTLLANGVPATEAEQAQAQAAAAAAAAPEGEGEPGGSGSVPEGVPPQGPSAPLTLAQRKMLEDHYDRAAGGVTFQQMWHRVRKLPGAPTNARAKEWLAAASAGQQQYYPQHGAYFTAAEAPADAGGAPSKPTVRKRNGKLVFDAPAPAPTPAPAAAAPAAVEPEPEPEPEPKPEPTPTLSPMPVDEADDGDLFGGLDGATATPGGAATSPSPQLFEAEPETPVLFEGDTAASQQAAAPASKAEAKAEAKAAEPPPPRKQKQKKRGAGAEAGAGPEKSAGTGAPRRLLAIDRSEKIEGKVFYHVVWQPDAADATGRMETWRRYSEFLELRQQLMEAGVGGKGGRLEAVPFPKKRLRNSAKVVDERIELLDGFLSAVVVGAGGANGGPLITPVASAADGPTKQVCEFLRPSGVAPQ
jgi:hypothetical protein